MASPNNPNAFTDNPLDRASHLRADMDWLTRARGNPETNFVPLCHLKPLVLSSKEQAGLREIGWVRLADLSAFDLSSSVFLGLDQGRPCFAIDVSTLTESEQAKPFGGSGSFEELLTFVSQIEPRSASLLAQAKSMIDWHRRHGYCAQCGTPTRFADAGYRRDCPECKAQHFPRTDPVVITLVVRGDKCLLGRNAMFKGPMFTALAGFLEPGETIEEAVAREVMEEVGIEVGNVAYRSTQPWPYPSSLMIGCNAEALTDTVTVDEKEIAEARWFTRRELRAALADAGKINYQELMSGNVSTWTSEFFVPPHSAIAHQLIRAWVAEEE